MSVNPAGDDMGTIPEDDTLASLILAPPNTRRGVVGLDARNGTVRGVVGRITTGPPARCRYEECLKVVKGSF
ncbi:hypothetical protein F2Q70_00010278 [Brassica cretica]|uniref:Uncharacterized protein n=1 Tax=Brassica cretica TaxID=69181 RepID=A0A8S9MCI1_BRACR|nr:hypothetical protein F2Q70_00010278 [Brassica cretica]